VIALLQRVESASVLVDGEVTGSIGSGLVVLLGVRDNDTGSDAAYLASRVAQLRIFNDADEKMNLSVLDVEGEALIISQFTLHGDTRKGNRPSWSHAAAPGLAEALYERFVDEMRSILGHNRVATGVFRAMMKVRLVNDGPVTVTVRSKSEFAGEA
jgi:D-tyrosyl-tRNA(Tyr) deacylase